MTGHILCWERGGSYKGLINKTMSTLMCLLLCSATAFDSEKVQTIRKVFGLSRKLQAFVAALYYWPTQQIDGVDSSYVRSITVQLDYIDRLPRLGRVFLDECDQGMQHDEQAGAVLDKPNVNRAMELAMHTLPCFGHARNCSEMVLEHMHQVFKGWLEKDTHDSSHITAVERALVRAWMGRVFASYSYWVKSSGVGRDCAELTLRRLLLGEEAARVDVTGTTLEEWESSFRESMMQSFQEPVLSMMQDVPHISVPGAISDRWEFDGAHEGEADEAMHRGLSYLLSSEYSVFPGM